MSSNNREYDGMAKSRTSYTTLANTWVYSCPYHDKNYPGFANGVNCLCAKTLERTSGDIAVIKGKKWPLIKNVPGWKF